MADLKYDFLDNSFFTTYQNVEVPKVELNLPIMDTPMDISDWASGIAEDGTPIVKDNRLRLYMINDNNPEPEITVSSPQQSTTEKSSTSNSSSSNQSNNSKTNREKQALNFFINKGLQKYQAAGIVGNLLVESPGLNTEAVGDNGSAYGIAQWRLDRRRALKEFASRRGKPMSDFETQLEFLWEEMNSSQKKYKVLEGLLSSKNEEEAALSFMKTFERPSLNPNINQILKRQKLAKALMK